MVAEALAMNAFAQMSAVQPQMEAQQMHNQMQNAGLFNQLGHGQMAQGNYAQPQTIGFMPGHYTLEHNVFRSPDTEETTVSTDKEILPDISIVRVLKWGVVLLIAMFLGKRVWETFGHKIAERVEGALKELV